MGGGLLQLVSTIYYAETDANGISSNQVQGGPIKNPDGNY